MSASNVVIPSESSIKPSYSNQLHWPSNKLWRYLRSHFDALPVIGVTGSKGFKLQALHMKQFEFEVVLRLSPCYGLRPWQLFGVDLQVAFAGPDIGADAKSNCSPNIGSWQGTSSATTLR